MMDECLCVGIDEEGLGCIGRRCVKVDMKGKKFVSPFMFALGGTCVDAQFSREKTTIFHALGVGARQARQK